MTWRRWGKNFVDISSRGKRSPIGFIYGGFLKWWVPPTTIGFPTKTDHFAVFWGYHHLRKHPYIIIYIHGIFRKNRWHAVDGRNLAITTWDVQSLVNDGINYQPQLVQVFFHRHYDNIMNINWRNDSRIPFRDNLIKLGQRRLAWPLRKDDMHKSRSAPSLMEGMVSN